MKKTMECYRRILAIPLVFMLILLQLQVMSYAADLPSDKEVPIMQTVQTNGGEKHSGMSPENFETSQAETAYPEDLAMGTSFLGTIETVFPDPALAQVIRASLGMSVDCAVTQTDLNKITSLSASHKSIEEIEGIQYLKSLTHIDLGHNRLQHIRPLENAELNNLKTLDLSNNRISSLNPLQNTVMSSLVTLELNDNRISNIGPLETLGLSNLKYLYLNNNQISDIHPLESSGISKLDTLYLYYNQISDIGPLENAGLSNLRYLYLYDNQIVDISPLENAQMSGLISLFLHRNQIADISPLENMGLSNLKNLYLGDNQISDISPLERAGMDSLAYLSLGNNRITDITALGNAGFAKLDTLMLYDNRISDIGPLQNADFSKMRYLYLDNNQISDISPLEKSGMGTNIFLNIRLDNNCISDITPLANLKLGGLTRLSNQVITLNSLNFSRPFIIQNVAKDLNGDLITPSYISHSGVYTEPHITWSNLESDATEVSFAFTTIAKVIESWNLEFSGTVTQPISETAPQPDKYTVNITTRYADGALPDSTETFTVADGDPFRHTLDILEGYEFAGISLLSNLHTFDPVTNTLSIDSVERDFDFVLEFDKALHKVAVTVHYLDDAAPDQTQTFWVEHWSPFSQQLDILEGYELAGVSVRANTHTYDPATNTLSIDSVEQDFEFYLEYDRIEYTVKVTVQYPDGSEQEMNYPVLYGDPLDVVFDVKDGYRAVSYRTGETGFSINLRSNSLKVNRVAKNMEFTILCS